MEKLLMKYFRNANSYQSIDPACFDLQEFTETWLKENEKAITVTRCCETFYCVSSAIGHEDCKKQCDGCKGFVFDD